MQLIALYDNSFSGYFLCLSISAKTNRLFFTIGGPDGVRGRFALFKSATLNFTLIYSFLPNFSPKHVPKMYFFVAVCSSPLFYYYWSRRVYSEAIVKRDDHQSNLH
jgi:hypothetical protein